MEDMEVRFSHIYRKGNEPDVIMSNLALSCNQFTWWNEGVPEISVAVMDAQVYRFSKAFFFSSLLCCFWFSFLFSNNRLCADFHLKKT